jgi:hypothetical protein
LSVVDDAEQLAWVVLLAANRTQAKGSTVRLVVPAAPEVADETGMELAHDRIVAVEEYLLKRGYIAPANIGLSWGTYTISPAGFSWLEGSLPGSSTTDRVQELAEKPGKESEFESALRSELEEERRRLEGVGRELDEEPSEAGGPLSVAEGRSSGETAPGSVEAQEGAQPRSWWRRVLGG